MIDQDQIARRRRRLLLSVGAAAAAPAVSRADLNVRSGPGTGYGVVGVIQAGETVDVGGCQGNWCQVSFDGGTGFANRSYLQMAGAPSAGVVVQAPVYDPYDDDYAYGYGYAPGVSIYAGPRFRHRHDGWRHGSHGGRDGRRGTRNAGGNWRGGDRTGAQLARRRPDRVRASAPAWEAVVRSRATSIAAAAGGASARRSACRRLRQRAPRQRAPLAAAPAAGARRRYRRTAAR